MLSENLKILRKQKGMSQETLAQQLNVVRQTVSKWEKGLSVPDADMLTRIADVFEVSVSELLGETVEREQDTNEVAVQLALLNEQLANRSRRNKKIWKGILIALLSLGILFALFVAMNVAVLSTHTKSEPSEVQTTQLVCTLGNKEYLYEITYDDQYQIVEAGGDAWITGHVQTEQYSDANTLIAQIENYFWEYGGTVERTDTDGTEEPE